MFNKKYNLINVIILVIIPFSIILIFLISLTMKIPKVFYENQLSIKYKLNKNRYIEINSKNSPLIIKKKVFITDHYAMCPPINVYTTQDAAYITIVDIDTVNFVDLDTVIFKLISEDKVDKINYIPINAKLLNEIDIYKGRQYEIPYIIFYPWNKKEIKLIFNQGCTDTPNSQMVIDNNSCVIDSISGLGNIALAKFHLQVQL